MNLLNQIRKSIAEAKKEGRKIKQLNLTDYQLLCLGRESGLSESESKEVNFFEGIQIKIVDAPNMIEFEGLEPISKRNPLGNRCIQFRSEDEKLRILQLLHRHPIEFRWTCGKLPFGHFITDFDPNSANIIHITDKNIIFIKGECCLPDEYWNTDFIRIEFEKAMEILSETPVEKESDNKIMTEFCWIELGKRTERLKKRKEFENNLPQSKEEELRFIAMTPPCETLKKWGEESKQSKEYAQKLKDKYHSELIGEIKEIKTELVDFKNDMHNLKNNLTKVKFRN